MFNESRHRPRHCVQTLLIRTDGSRGDERQSRTSILSNYISNSMYCLCRVGLVLFCFFKREIHNNFKSSEKNKSEVGKHKLGSYIFGN